MKKILFICCLLLVGGCNDNEEIVNLNTKQDYAPMQISETPNLSVDDHSLEESLMNHQREGYTGHDDYTSNFTEESEPNFALSSDISNEIKKLEGIQDVNCIIKDNNAYVAVQSSEKMNDRLDAKIRTIVQEYNPTIQNVSISDDNELFTHMNGYVEKIQNNAPLKDWYVDFTTTMEKAFDLR